MYSTAIKEETRLRKDVTPNKLAYSVEEISTQTGLSESFLRNEIRAGNLKVARFGRRVLVLKENLQDYLKGNEN